ncbi:BatD family protein [Hymenobacter sp. BT770]|uniref:BatD family protein n=1 Tax=Hymenobacter sp. BT770 TaxID=2886942 RepID=UPI001D0F565C|nr:BatD family protein [Hymenobacter sp. BT770]MCC3151807.1 BatD family protein [Hymenobacter sp. BT770]MDO3413571.1 BatD family protein [Hymenobacter sp. BT770]
MGKYFGWVALLVGCLGVGIARAQPTTPPTSSPTPAAPAAQPKPIPAAPVTQPQPQPSATAPVLQPKPGAPAPATQPKPGPTVPAAPSPLPAIPKPSAVPPKLGATAPSEVALVPGPAMLPVTGVFTLGFRLHGGVLEKYSEFPELEGFKKTGKTSTTTTRIVQGRRFTDLTITQRYIPYGEGEYTIKPFQLTVNGVVLRSTGATVRVGPAPTANPAALTKPANSAAPLQAVGDLDKLFGKPKPALYQELPDRAFLAVVADRPSVYVGEGVRVGLYFYLTPADQAQLAFHDFNDQLPPLLRELHQASAWQEPGPEPSVTPDTVRSKGQLYLRFRLAENVYYPLTTQPLHFPPLALTMVKFKFLKKPEPGQDNRLAGYKTYLSLGTTVQVRPLPQQAQRGAVAVGSYRVREAISRTTFRVGQSFAYTFGVEGRGNLSAILAPAFAARPGLEVYGPEVSEVPAPGGGRKLFRYRLVARQPGTLPLDSLLQLVVFNPATARYDTLRPELRPKVRGDAGTPAPLPKPEDDPFYGPALANADTTMQSLDVYRDVRRYSDWVLLGLAGVAGFGWWRAGRRR